MEWNGTSQVVPYIDFDVAKLQLAETIEDHVRDENVFQRLFEGVDAVGQDDFGHLGTHVDRFDDVAVDVDVLKGVFGDGGPDAGLAVFVHGVTSCQFDFDGSVVWHRVG